MNIMDIIKFLGGLAIFLYSMKLMSDNLNAVAGDEMKRILKKLTNTPLKGVFVGLAVTSIIQSSSATSVMLIGLVNSGIMNLTQAIGVIMGANIGTTITGQLIAFKFINLAYAFIIIGIILIFIKHSKAMERWALIILGFGLLFVAIDIMSKAVLPLQESNLAIEFLISLSTNPILAVLMGTVFTMLIQSSSASIGIVIVLTSKGLIQPLGAMYLVFGDNIGTTITAWLASLSVSRSGKRIALIHTLFNVIGTIIFIALTSVGYYEKFIWWVTPGNLPTGSVTMPITPEIEHMLARFVANTHTYFNVINCLLFLPFTGYLEKIVMYCIQKDSTETISTGEPKHLNPLLIPSSVLAVEQSIKEMSEMLKLVKLSLEVSMEAYNTRNYRKQEKVVKIENAIDQLQKEITLYLVAINDHSNSRIISQKIPSLLHTVNDIEKMGDFTEQINEILNNQIQHQKTTFFPEFLSIIEDSYTKTIHMCDLTLQCLEHFDRNCHDTVIEMELSFRTFHNELRKEILTKIQNADCDAESGLNTIDYIDEIEMIAKKLTNIVKARQNRFVYQPADRPQSERKFDGEE